MISPQIQHARQWNRALKNISNTTNNHLLKADVYLWCWICYYLPSFNLVICLTVFEFLRCIAPLNTVQQSLLIIVYNTNMHDRRQQNIFWCIWDRWIANISNKFDGFDANLRFEWGHNTWNDNKKITVWIQKRKKKKMVIYSCDFVLKYGEWFWWDCNLDSLPNWLQPMNMIDWMINSISDYYLTQENKIILLSYKLIFFLFESLSIGC